MACLDLYFERIHLGPPFKQNEEMKFEALRIASYVDWPNWAHKRPGELAQNGFYYMGDGDRVTCFSCKMELSNCNLETRVNAEHKEKSPVCAFVLGGNSGNVQLVDKPLRQSFLPSKQSNGLQIDCYAEQADSGFGDDKSLLLTIPGMPGTRHNNIKDADELLEELQSLGSVKNSVQNADHADLPPPVSLDQRGPSTSHSLEMEPGTGQITEIDLQFVKYESYRNRTFEGKWPGDSYVSPGELAKSGFYFVSAPDRVQCAFCKGRLLNWKSTDIPSLEHKRHFPDCPFVLGRNVGNVLIEQSQSSVQVPKHMKEKKKDMTPSERLGIMMDKPKNPNYAIEALRVDSFKTWPKKTTISVENLANAGFFYVGYSDNVKCFFCDGGLRNWDPADNPWREHARWFSRCGFLKLKMGEDYVNKILAETNATGNSKTTQQTYNTPVVRKKTPPPMDPRELMARMDTPMVRSVIGMGFDREAVKTVISARLKTEGDDFANAEELLQAVFEHQEVLDKKNRPVTPPGDAAAGSAGNKPGISRRKKKNRNKKKKKRTEGKGGPDGSSLPEPDNESDSECEDVPEVAPEPEAHIQEDEEVQALVRQYNRIKEERTCKICMDQECTIVFLPCGHLVCCADCAPALRNCPICRTLIKGSVRIYTT